MMMIIRGAKEEPQIEYCILKMVIYWIPIDKAVLIIIKRIDVVITTAKESKAIYSSSSSYLLIHNQERNGLI